MDWDSYFKKAKKLSTLERMIMSKVEEMGIRYNPGRESLRVVADTYRRLRPSAYEMLAAAYKREQELEATPSPSTTKTTSTRTESTATDSIQNGLEAEMEAWMARNRRALS
ncbi:hypothetical protein [Marinobacterium aestuariivivens]|uniref:Uncharacterized protein n=1 Tax=Marinobacterium aestuariivivens TaxID=1698799 RepID=A0ABW2A7X0_9GAMM